MTPTETPRIQAAAARNNAEWCAAVCRSHGIAGDFGDTVWSSARRTHPYYPDAVTLRPDARPADVLAGIDTASPGCSVKDSFAALDLTPHGFAELFTARWIHRPAAAPAPMPASLRVERVSSASELGDWQTAWHGGDVTADVFRPPLLDDPSVVVLALHDGRDLAGGAVLNHGSGVVGVSNLFAVDAADLAAVWPATVTAAAARFPGLPLVGYEHADDLAPALASGFTELGPLRVWLRGA
ncbi:hypothetical protein [Streptomyces sp. NPDC127098]|uniref:hypothetical protein n=1 Tax=Streptomyces sp. NPDC127098 TaxID=3347137 RepID=UPI003650181C